MTPEQGFLADIIDNPDDDLPRLVYADWLEESGDVDRAEFIRIQCRRAALQEGTQDGLPLRQRAEHLLRTHWSEWVGPLARLLSRGRHTEDWLRADYHPEALYKFRGGFIYLLDVDAPLFLDHAEELFRLAPLRHLRLFNAGAVAARLAACPALGWLSSLDFVDYFCDPIDAAAMEHLANSPHIRRLRMLGLYHNNLGDRGVLALAAAPWLAGLVSLELGQNGFARQGAEALAHPAHPFRPLRLRLGGNPIGDRGVAALASSPVVSRLRVLGLDRVELGPAGAQALAASSHLRLLRSLDLSGNALGLEGCHHLEAAPWWSSLDSIDLG